MSDTRATIDADGRLVLPAAIRARHGWSSGTQLVAVDGANGVTLIERGTLKAALRVQLAGHDVVAELLADRRRDALLDSA